MPSPRRQLPDRRTPRDAEHAGLQLQRDLVGLGAETQDVEHDGGAVVGGVVGDLHAAHLLDALAGSRERERDQVVGEPGIHSGDEQARISLLRNLFERSDVLVRQDLPGVLQRHRSGADDVDAAGQDAAHVLHRPAHPVIRHRAVDGAVGLGRQQRLQVIRGGDSGRNIQSGKLTRVPAHLGFRRHAHAGEFELRIGDEPDQCQASDISGADVGDADGHGVSPHEVWSGDTVTSGCMPSERIAERYWNRF